MLGSVGMPPDRDTEIPIYSTWSKLHNKGLKNKISTFSMFLCFLMRVKNMNLFYISRHIMYKQASTQNIFASKHSTFYEANHKKTGFSHKCE